MLAHKHTFLLTPFFLFFFLERFLSRKEDNFTSKEELTYFALKWNDSFPIWRKRGIMFHLFGAGKQYDGIYNLIEE